MIWVEVEFQGRSRRVPAVRHQGRLWFHWLGEVHVLEVGGASARRAGGERNKSQPGVITAPMPGKITQVFVNVGDPVTKGQPLVVMEAMKMEYTLAADRDGKVKTVTATFGAQVALGDVLVRLEE